MPDVESAVRSSLAYLASDEALASIDANPYWPKWHSPWWHMTTLHEMGLGHLIPRSTAEHLIRRHRSGFFDVFPIHPGDLPSGVSAPLETSCHCGLGNIHQALTASGADVDGGLPWIRPWFLRYQLADGGLNCDYDAYLLDEPPSSIVGTIAPLEAVLLDTPRAHTPEELRFLDRGAACLLGRELRRGSDSLANAEERDDESDWLKPCFPRLYFYDVLRGLSFVLQWSEKLGRTLPYGAIRAAVGHLEERYPDGRVRIERLAYEGVGTRARDGAGEWERGRDATLFPLLEQVSRVGDVSPYLSRQWQEARARLGRLGERGLLVE